MSLICKMPKYWRGEELDRVTSIIIDLKWFSCSTTFQHKHVLHLLAVLLLGLEHVKFF